MEFVNSFDFRNKKVKLFSFLSLILFVMLIRPSCACLLLSLMTEPRALAYYISKMTITPASVIIFIVIVTLAFFVEFSCTFFIVFYQEFILCTYCQ